jgi:hypothetical protein
MPELVSRYSKFSDRTEGLEIGDLILNGWLVSVGLIETFDLEESVPDWALEKNV